MYYRKVLLLGQTFNDFSGGGITLSSLFKEWPTENLAVVSYPFMLHRASTDLCHNYYQLGIEELRWRFPFSLFKQKYPSGKIELKSQKTVSSLKESRNIRNSLSANILTPIIKWTGLVHCISSIHLSQKLKDWISHFSPDLIYMQISNRESIIFADELINYLQVPSVIHMMDDWPSTISVRGILSQYWRRKIDIEFRSLLAETDLHLSISEAMSEEYLKRYARSFRAFHNPVEPECFKSAPAREAPANKKFKVLYIGRIGKANKKTLDKFGRVISKHESKFAKVEFDVYTKDINTQYARKLAKNSKVNMKAAVSHDEVPGLLKSADLLLLPLDFSGSAIKFSRLSMPTKASEYMMSGTPMLVLAPAETAISRFCEKNECGHCVLSSDTKDLSKAIDILLKDKQYRQKLCANAIILAEKLFDANVVRGEFRTLLMQLESKKLRN